MNYFNSRITTLRYVRMLMLLILLATVFAFPLSQAVAGGGKTVAKASQDNRYQNQMVYQPKIQLAILLDTSSSMSGLIDQTRQQLWQIVNEFSRATQNGIAPKLEVAIYEYGNSGLSSKNGFIRKVSGLTTELDQVSEVLFALTTNGGDEYCGYVIQTAVNELQWSQSNNDIKAIFIAGNEPFTQGPVKFKHAISHAKQRGVTVNTIHAGDYNQGANSGWRDGAVLAGGNYMSIDHNQKVAHIQAPQDKEIARLNQELNKTYVPYGAKGKQKARRQLEQDRMSQAASPALLSKRAISKSSSFYGNSSWDLVDATTEGKVELEKLEDKALPEDMRKLDDAGRRQYVEEKAAERKQLKKQIQALSRDRDEYVAKEKRKAAKSAANTMDDAVVEAVRKQGESKKFVFK